MVTYKWGVFDGDGIQLRGPFVPDEVCDTFSAALSTAGEMLADGIYEQLTVRRVCLHKSKEYWVASKRFPGSVELDARDLDPENIPPCEV